MKKANKYIHIELNRKLTTTAYIEVEEAIKQAQKDAYNEALEDAAKNVRMFKAGNSGSYLDAAIDTESILKLKKQ